MKDYEHVVIWLDYFNKNLKKSKGRRLGLGKCIFDLSIILSSLLPYFSEKLYFLIKDDTKQVSESVHLLSYSDLMLVLAKVSKKIAA